MQSYVIKSPLKATEKIPRILNHKMVQGGDFIALCKYQQNQDLLVSQKNSTTRQNILTL